MQKIEEIIVVEGRDDTAAIRRAVDAVTIETHGFGIREETWDLIEKAYRTKGIIVFTDPDTAGEQIRRRILERFPEAAEAFLDRDAAEKDGDIGIENASPEDICAALDKAHAAADRSGAHAKAGGSMATDGSTADPSGQIRMEAFTADDLFRWGLDGMPGAGQRRREVGRILGIGQATARTFLKRLNRFGIPREEIEAALQEMEQELP